jgi:Tryptophan-associated transmembrane protein (Trp_oprn_chp)
MYNVGMEQDARRGSSPDQDLRPSVLPIVLGLLGAGLLVGGALTVWLERPGGNFSLFDGVVTGTVRGTAFPSGMVALGAGIGAVVLSALLLTPFLRRSAGLLLIIAGLVAGLAAIYFLVTIDDRLAEHATAEVSSDAHPPSEVDPFIEMLIRTERISVDPGLGVYLAAAGAVSSIVAGAWAVRGPSPARG